MSSTSIHDQGYTPLDFLQKNCLTTPSLASTSSRYTPTSQPFIGSSFDFLKSSPDLLRSPAELLRTTSHHVPFSPAKIMRSHSLGEEERISTKKFKLFFNTIAEGMFSEEEANGIWQKFEKCLTNPFEFDRFIEDIRMKSYDNKKQKPQCPFELSELEVGALKNRANSLIKKPVHRPEMRRNRSAYRIYCQQVGPRSIIKRQIGYINKIIRHGEKFIQSK